MEVSGKILSIEPTAEFGANNFKVAKFKLDLSRFDPNTGEAYPNEGEFQATGKRTADIEAMGVGDKVKVTFNIKGREVDKKDGSGKVFIQNLEAFKIERLEVGSKTTVVATDDEDSGLPF